MTSAAPPGPLRVIVLLARVALRRWLNRAAAGFRRKKQGSPSSAKATEGRPDAPRTGTPRKGGPGFLGLAFLGLMFMGYGFMLSYQFLHQLGANLERGTLASEEPPSMHSYIPWTASEQRAAALRTIGIFLFMLAASQVFLGLGQGNQDLGKVEWSLEWLFSFPVSARTLFLAKVLEGTVVNPIGWFLIFPFLCMVYWTAALEAWAFPLGIATMLFLGLILSSVRVTLETWLRMRLSLERLKNIQALCTLVGTLLWLAILAVALARPTPAFFLKAAPHVPAAFLWNPLSLPVLLFGPGGRIGGAPAAVMGVLAALLPFGAVSLCGRLVRDGLLRSSGGFQGTRRVAAPTATVERKPLVRGILSKDLRLLLRDRNFLVTTLLVPVILFGFQLILNPALVRGVTGDYRHAATLAFGLGAYILMSSAFHILSVEGGALWLLYTFPRELHSILLQKTVLWAGVALVYAGIVLGVTAALNRSLDGEAIALGVTAAVGVVLSAFIAGALGTLAADPLQNEPQRKIRPEILYLYMMLSSMYGYAIYGPSAWARLVQVILSSLLVLALWQKVRDRLPYLLDPTETPPPSIALSDGLIATLAFFVLQGLFTLAMVKAGIPFAQSVLVGYVAAGGLVAVFTLYLFWRHKVPRLFEALGFRSPSSSLLRSLALGALAGTAAAALALGYLWLAARIEPLRTLTEEALEQGKHLPEMGSAWIALLAVVAAPLFEEYLFRGLVFKGLRRSMTPAFAILASAAIFAIVHPPVSFVPVFGLGVAAALAFEGSGSLLAPILAHALYNGAVVFLSR